MEVSGGGAGAATEATARRYEFSETENLIIRRTGGRTKILGILALAFGIFLAVLGLFFLALGPVGVIGTVVYGGVSLIPIFIGVFFIRAGNALEGVASTSGTDIPRLMSALESQGKAFLMAIIAAVVAIALIMIGIIAIPRLGDSREMAYLAAQRSDLRNLAAVQEIYYGSDNDGDGQPDQVYAASFEKLPHFQPSAGVELTLVEAGPRGWAATSLHQALAGRGCVIFDGAVSALPRTPGGRSAAMPGDVVCD
ncbi:MAG: hypothetical protein HY561_13740 [Gemmatimonadetes bacterium]|nr:hypothetical protein [Gemmatimonadota bacterium]